MCSMHPANPKPSKTRSQDCTRITDMGHKNPGENITIARHTCRRSALLLCRSSTADVLSLESTTEVAVVPLQRASNNGFPASNATKLMTHFLANLIKPVSKCFHVCVTGIFSILKHCSLPFLCLFHTPLSRIYTECQKINIVHVSICHSCLLLLFSSHVSWNVVT